MARRTRKADRSPVYDFNRSAIVSPRRILAGAAFAVVFIVTIAALIKWAPGWLASDDRLDPKARVEEVGRVRTGLLAALAGLIAMTGAYYTGRTFALNRQGQITERFTRAVDQLGNAVLDVRIGGIYALERLARESRDDHGPIMEVLTAYVRDHAPAKVGDDDEAETSTSAQPTNDVQAALAVLAAYVHGGAASPIRSVPDVRASEAETPKPSTDVQAALVVLARRRVENDSGPALDLSFTELSGAQLRGAQLAGANFRGANFDRAELSYARLNKAILVGANLATARSLGDAVLDSATYDATTIWPQDFDPAAKGAVKTGVRRRLVACCDGTWSRRERSALGGRASTNVYKMAEAVAPEDSQGTPQRVRYQPGGGRGLGGLSREVQDCYRFIVDSYEPGDDLYLFGFSRGAFIARSVVGLLRTAGVLRREHADRIEDAYRLYRSRNISASPSGIEARTFRGLYAHPDTEITFIGVWETVGALGIPFGLSRFGFLTRRWAFHDDLLSRHVRHACQALAIDERRAAFTPTLWQAGSGVAGQNLEQVWFAGNHGDVGGGYENSELAEIPLLWMAQRARSAGLALKPDHFVRSDRWDLGQATGAVVAPDALGVLHDSLSALDRMAAPRRRQLEADGGAVASSAVKRMEHLPDYAPPSLVEYVERGGPIVETEPDALLAVAAHD